jgi:hypothetical protein
MIAPVIILALLTALVATESEPNRDPEPVKAPAGPRRKAPLSQPRR